MLAAPAADWEAAVDKAKYLLSLFSASAEAQDPRRKKLMANLLVGFDRLLGPGKGPRTVSSKKGLLRDWVKEVGGRPAERVPPARGG